MLITFYNCQMQRGVLVSASKIDANIQIMNFCKFKIVRNAVISGKDIPATNKAFDSRPIPFLTNPLTKTASAKAISPSV